MIQKLKSLRIPKWIIFIVFLILSCPGCLLLVMLYYTHRPVDLPAPTGKFAVGRTAIDWIDSSRRETFSDDPDDYRELAGWIWYPAHADSAARADYLPDGWLEARKHVYGITAILTQSLTSIHGNAYADAPLSDAEATYPVLIFMPGLGPIPLDYSTLLEDLASHGYIVLGINPTYSSSFTVFADGRVVQGNSEANIPDSAKTVVETHDAGAKLMRVWAGDALFGIEQLEKLNADENSPFFNRLDMAHLGILGHSFGGATAAQVCHMDDRCLAGVNLDGYPYGDVIHTGVLQPFMFIESETSRPDDELYRQAEKDRRDILATSAAGYTFVIDGARHFNFSDYGLFFSPVLHVLGATGSINGAYALDITRAYVLAFFDTYLKNQASPLLDGEPPYPEVHVMD